MIRVTPRKNRCSVSFYTGCLLLLTSFLLSSGTSHAQDKTRDVNLQWLLSKEPDTEGYKIHYGPVSRYDNGFEGYAYLKDLGSGDYASEGTKAEYVLQGLDSTKTFWISMTAYDSNDNESSFSNEKKVPAKGTGPVSPCQSIHPDASIDTVRTLLPGWVLLFLSVSIWLLRLRSRVRVSDAILKS